MDFPTATHFAAHPGLIPWLKEWECANPTTAEKASKMVVTSIRLAEKATVVGELELVVHGAVRDPFNWTLTPKVYLEPTYSRATRTFAYGWTSECGCGAAIFLRARRGGDDRPARHRGGRPASPGRG
jgi:hypothetical protein